MFTRPKAEPALMVRRRRKVPVRVMTGQPARWLAAALCFAVLPPLASAKTWVQEPRDADTVRAVWAHIDNKDCAGAVRELNAGVGKNHPGVLLLAGAMFEGGVCLKQNWTRASDYFLRAHDAGHPRAAARLAAGYAAPVGGPDKAAALWWAVRAGSSLPMECMQVAPLVEDPDRFVKALQAWPQARIDACVYVAGVMNSITGDMDFSSRAALYGMKGELTLIYLPAQGRVEVQTDRIEFIQLQGVVDGNALLERDNRQFKREFALDAEVAAERALRRYVKPAVIDEAWRLTTRLTFNFVTCATCR